MQTLNMQTNAIRAKLFTWSITKETKCLKLRTSTLFSFNFSIIIQYALLLFSLLNFWKIHADIQRKPHAAVAFVRAQSIMGTPDFTADEFL